MKNSLWVLFVVATLALSSHSAAASDFEPSRESCAALTHATPATQSDRNLLDKYNLISMPLDSGPRTVSKINSAVHEIQASGIDSD